MGYSTTRPRARLRACRAHWRILLVLTALLAGGPAATHTGTAQVDRVIDGDTIRDQPVGWSGWARSGVLCREEG